MNLADFGRVEGPWVGKGRFGNWMFPVWLDRAIVPEGSIVRGHWWERIEPVREWIGHCRFLRGLLIRTEKSQGSGPKWKWLLWFPTLRLESKEGLALGGSGDGE